MFSVFFIHTIMPYLRGFATQHSARCAEGVATSAR